MKTSSGVAVALTGMSAVALLLTSGCTLTCGEIGWRNTLTVTVTDVPTQLDEVRVCADRVCSRPSDSLGSGEERSFWSTQVSESVWSFDFGTESPSNVTITLLGADGRTQSEQKERIDWEPAPREDNRCPGPMNPAQVEIVGN
jgi:hypothetical protein